MSSTVLVVDDEVDLLFTIGLSLELAGYRVVKASTGEAGRMGSPGRREDEHRS